MIKQFIRTFHPVGQGAFYTEKIMTEARLEGYNIVYDCGSETSDKLVHLEKQVNGAFPKGENIDILFISHFHADHINGIKYLKDKYKIKKVVMPLLDDVSKVLARISLILEKEETAIIDNPQSYFGDETTIIQVNPVSNSENTQDPKEYTIENLYAEGIINSGDRIKVSIDWYYIPYNYKLTTRSAQFINKLRRLGVTVADIKTIDQIENNREKIIKAYKKVDSRLNPLSLILYSGKNYNTTLKTYHSKYHYLDFNSRYSGCLYLGDIDLNQVNIVDEIVNRLDGLWGTISMIQIPHHGSIENFKDSILSSSMKFAILSYGTTNSYGHPASYVQGSLLLHSIYPLHITEVKDSIVMQLKNNLQIKNCDV